MTEAERQYIEAMQDELADLRSMARAHPDKARMLAPQIRSLEIRLEAAVHRHRAAERIDREWNAAISWLYPVGAVAGGFVLWLCFFR